MHTAVEQLPIFEPLCEAARDELQPLAVGENDYLEIRTGLESEKLRLKPETWRLLYDDQGNQLVRLREDEEIRTTFTGQQVVRVSSWIRCMSRRWLSKFPERIIPKGSFDEHEVPLTEYSCLLIHCCWPKERLIFSSDDTKFAYLECLLRFFATNSRANMVARFKGLDEVPEMPEDFDEGNIPLSDYQKVGLLFGLEKDSSAYFMDRGTGKTAVTVALCSLEAKRTRQGLLNPHESDNGEGHMARYLVVVPGQVRLNWQREFAKFSTTPGKVTILRGGRTRRVKLLTEAVKSDPDCAFSAAIVSYDTLTNDYDTLKLIPWDRIICDESQYFKSPSTNRWKTLNALKLRADRRLILTGSPIGNSFSDLWSQLEFGHPGNSGFSSYKTFKRFHGQYDRQLQGEGIDKLLGLKHVPLLQERLARWAYAVTKEEAKLNLPDKVYDYHEVEMTKRQKEIYHELKNNLIVEIENEVETSDQPREMVAEHVLTKLLRLAQITSGHVTWNAIVDEETGEELQPKLVQQIHDDPRDNPKFAAVLQFLRNREPGEKKVIWCCFKPDIRELHALLQVEGFRGGTYYGATPQSQRDKNVDAFNNDPDWIYLVCNPASAGEGLNLLGYDVDNPEGPTKDTYCGHEIFLSSDWSSLKRGQAEDRAHRRGTKYPVRITDLVVPGTVDPDIRERINEKQKMAGIIQDVSAILKSVLDLDLTLRRN